jgi:hypothetical protein
VPVADLLRLLPRLLAALGSMLVQETASLRGLVQEGPALLDARLLGRACPDDLVAEGAGGSRKHPRPWVGGVRLGGDPRGPPQYLWKGRRWGPRGPQLGGCRPPLTARLGGCP